MACKSFLHYITVSQPETDNKASTD